MNQSKTVLLLFFITIIFASSCQKEAESNLTLFSEQIPQDSALIFGEGIISKENFEFAITFSPEMDELFYTSRKPEGANEIITMQYKNGQWSNPSPVFFKAEVGWDFEPHINPTGDKLYFGSIRPHLDTLKPRALYQWYAEKSDHGWSTPKPIEKNFEDRFMMYLTTSKNGNLYFTSQEEEDEMEDGGIYYSINENGQYNKVKKLGDEVNFDGKWIAHPYIAPDESYLIYDGESESGFGENDLYISFNQNGNWTKAVNMGPKVNTPLTEMCASVSPDGQYLFFHRGDDETGDIYWIDFIRLKKDLLSQSK
ncbi:TolB-like translocation protein [Fulvivirga lutea]|uniref:PD40 domain-containing protein n=1 Tax=Fulvivirga lutea TaxID=2810512 RepID=A0A974WKC0_9BACT|nr:PD40 domain-containing protein [Fulvivirga lutea]QSE98797.1 PD40 domain-containing protein [Fulvivirga lutea]